MKGRELTPSEVEAIKNAIIALNSFAVGRFTDKSSSILDYYPNITDGLQDFLTYYEEKLAISK